MANTKNIVSFQDAKRKRNKEKANRAFLKQYGTDTASSGDSGAGAPRAALYKGKMGARQRKASKIQERSSSTVAFQGGSSSRSHGFSLASLSKRTTTVLTVLVSVVVVLGLLYTPAQQCYQQMRERDRLAAEYAAIQQRNESLQGLVDNLQSEEGIEDKALSDFGMVKKDEKAGAVSGVDFDEVSKFQANIVPGSVPAPDTWYSGILDLLFGYSS